METVEKKETAKLQRHAKGFALVGFLDAAMYDFFVEFGLYFLTAFGKMKSGVAGSVISVATLLNAVLNPIIGYISDKSSAKMGRRRFYFFVGGLGCVILLPLMLIPTPFDGGAKIAFYGFVVIAFWIAYALFFPPYLAYGADITEGYDERSNLRTWVTICNNAGTLVAYSGALIIVAALTGLGMTEHMSYFMAGLLISLTSLICLVIGTQMTKGYDISMEKAEKLEIGKFIKNLLIAYGSALKLKSMRIIICIILFSIIGYTMKTNAEMFMLVYNAKLGAAAIALYFLITSLISLVRPIPTKWFCDWWGKKGGFLVCVALYLVSAVFFLYHGINGFADVIWYAIFNGFLLSGYWQIVPAMIYDITDVDMYFYKQKREGTLVSFQALVESAGGAIGAFFSGMWLAWFNFNEAAAEEAEGIEDAVAQSAHATDGVLYLSTVVPAIFFIIASIFVIIFPINKKRHERLREALDKGIYAEDNDPEYEDLKVLN